MRSRPVLNELASLPDSIVAGSAELVRFAHPGYDESIASATFLTLPCVDDGGICFDTAMVACGILACNRYDGYLSTDRAGRDDVVRPADDVLRGRRYYYQLESHWPARWGEPPPYPLLAGFADWRFPHGNLPGPWGALRLRTNVGLPPTTVSSRGQGSCAVTGYGFSQETAQCVPYDERKWWDLNEMSHYIDRHALRPLHPQNSPQNLMVLRADVKGALARREFCFTPKLVEVGTAEEEAAGMVVKEVRLVVHVVTPSLDGPGQMAGLWHNRELWALPPGLSKECLFARFAYTMFDPRLSGAPLLSSAAGPRYLCTRDPSVSDREVHRWQASRGRRIAIAHPELIRPPGIAPSPPNSPPRFIQPPAFTPSPPNARPAFVPPPAALLPAAPIRPAGRAGVAVAAGQGHGGSAVAGAYNGNRGGVVAGGSSQQQDDDVDRGSDSDDEFPDIHTLIGRIRNRNRARGL